MKWCVVDNHAKRLRCDRCGQEKPLEFPVPLSVLTTQIDQFCEKHAACKASGFWPTSAPYVKIALGWAQEQPYCPEDLGEGACPGEQECPGLRHKTANWVIHRVMDGLAKHLQAEGYAVVNAQILDCGNAICAWVSGPCLRHAQEQLRRVA